MRIAFASLVFVLTFGIAPAFAGTPYQAGVSDRACKDRTSCVLIFPAVATGETLTISHVSCGILTGGLLGVVNNVVLSTTKTAKTAIGDHLLFDGEVLGTNVQNIVSAATFFLVNAGDSPTVSITASSAMSFTNDGGCFISGTLSP